MQSVPHASVMRLTRSAVDVLAGPRVSPALILPSPGTRPVLWHAITSSHLRAIVIQMAQPIWLAISIVGATITGGRR
jgi:hypothetical protein